MDTWISWIFGYMDTWIHVYPFSLDTWILGCFGYQFFSLSRFWISYLSIRIFLDNFLNYHKLKKGNEIQVLILCSTDNGHPETAFFQKFKTFGLGQTNWAEILGGILSISSQTIGTILAL